MKVILIRAAYLISRMRAMEWYAVVYAMKSVAPTKYGIRRRPAVIWQPEDDGAVVSYKLRAESVGHS